MNAIDNKIKTILQQGADFLDSQQQTDGSFLSLSTSSHKNFTNSLVFHSVFSNALILSSLYQLENTGLIAKIRKKIAEYLLKQKSKHWSFNYWARDSEEFQTIPYPDDLDDTFCALSALYQYDPKLIDGDAMSHIVSLLTALEVKEGGPYRTWLVDTKADAVWKDVDPAVNSNIAFFLSLQDISLTRVTHYIESAIERNTCVSPYYPTPIPIYYFISRFYRGNKKDKLVQTILAKRKKDQTWGNPIDTALALSSLLKLNVHIQKIETCIHFLINTQKNGSWHPYPFYTGVNPTRDKNDYLAGSAALTTALCLEALNKYYSIIHTPVKTISLLRSNKKEEDKIYPEIIRKVKKRFAGFDDNVQKPFLNTLKRIFKKDKNKQIALLPYFFSISLYRKKNKIPQRLLIDLGYANVLGWIAYTIYDDFLDLEGDPQFLSVATIALRELTIAYNQMIPNNILFQDYFRQTMNTIDQANAWEVNNCRIKTENIEINLKSVIIPDYGNYEKLAEKSLGHALGPVAVLFSLGYSGTHNEIKNLIIFFTHYLIARQLNDDAHDWEQDLNTGHINAAGALLFKKIKKRLKYPDISLTKLMPRLQNIFWHEVLQEICEIIFIHSGIAREALYKCRIIQDHTLFNSLLTKYEDAAKTALKEQKNALSFIKSYNSPQ